MSFGALMQGLELASAGAAAPITAKAPIVNATIKDFSMFVSPFCLVSFAVIWNLQNSRPPAGKRDR